jgi:hypothetical protein
MISEYKWITEGDDKDPIIAIIGTSADFIGQEGIRKKIDRLVGKGLRVRYAQYTTATGETQIVTEPGVKPLKGTNFTPATSPETCAQQLIDCIKAGIDISPLMGGWSFNYKIPHIVKYFEENPDQKNTDAKIYGFSDVTFATILQSHDICQFILAPVSYVVTRAEDETRPDEERRQYQEAAEQLLKMLKSGVVDSGSNPRTILQDANEKLIQLSGSEIEFYPMHYDTLWGIVVKEGENQYDKRHCEVEFKIPEKSYAIGIEGFLQQANANKHYQQTPDVFLNSFLQKIADEGKNLPEFLELGCFSSRLDGQGPDYLIYSEVDGTIESSDFNIQKLLAAKAKIREGIQNIHEEQRTADETISPLTQLPQDILKKSQNGEELNEKDIADFIKHENAQINAMRDKIMKVAEKHGVPVIQNTQHAHALNLRTVGGGTKNKITVCDRKLTIENLGVENLKRKASTTLENPEAKKMMATEQNNQPQ